MKRSIATLLTLALFFALPVSAVEHGGIEMPLVSEPVTLTMFWEADPKATTVISTYADMAYFQKMRELTGIEIEFLHPATGQTPVEFNLMLAADDLPDIVWYDWSRVTGGMASLIAKGMFLDLTDRFPACAPNLSRYYAEHPEIAKAAMLDDGTLYSFPKIKGDSSILVTSGFQIRKDWLEQLGLQPPKSIADWHDVLTAFRDHDMNGNGDPNDEIPFTCTNNAILKVPEVFAPSWNLMFNDFSLRGDRIVYGPATEEYRDFIATMAQWYREGLIDPDYLSVDAKSFESKVMTDVAGAYYGTINGNLGKFLAAWENEGAQKDLLPLVNPYLKAGDPIYSKEVQSYVSNDSVAITKNNRYVEETMRYFDFGYSEEGMLLGNYGVEGVSYEMVEGKPTFTDLILNNPDGYAAINALHLFNYAISQGPGIQLGDTFKQAAVYPQQVDAYDRFGNGVVKINLTNLTNLSPTDEEGARLAAIMTDVKTYVDEYANKMIMGLLPLSAYDEFVAQIRAMGVEEAIEIEQRAYDRYLNR